MEKSKKKIRYRKPIIAFFVLSVFMFVGSIAGTLVLIIHEKPSHENTIELAATVVSIEAVTRGGENQYIIHSVEFGNKLLLRHAYVNMIAEPEALKAINSGKKVFFGIETIWLSALDLLPEIHVVTLRTDDKVFISLDYHINYLNQQHILNIVIGFLLGLVGLLVSVHCILLLNGKNIFMRSRTK